MTNREEQFKREERYVVLKLSHMSEANRNLLSSTLQSVGLNDARVECVVVESDWPEYEPVWKMIQDRMEGNARPTDWIPAPLRNGKPEITTEMKAECMGEFTFTVEDSCSACYLGNERDHCEVCGGDIYFERTVTVPWDTCKEIYKKMASVAGKLSPAPRGEG